jgi:hypothetical protein
VLSDEQAAEQDLEEVRGRPVAVAGRAEAQTVAHAMQQHAVQRLHGVAQLSSGAHDVAEQQPGSAGCHCRCDSQEVFLRCCSCSGTAWSLVAGPFSAWQTSCAVTC